MSDIIDRIDELVDDQLANYDSRSGYDHNINQDKCGHCGGDWHGLAITQKIMAMRVTRSYNEDYGYAADDSPIICPGSDFIGPLSKRAETAPWISELIDATNEYVAEVAGFLGIPAMVWPMGETASTSATVSFTPPLPGALWVLPDFTYDDGGSGYQPIGYITGDIREAQQ